MPQSAAVFSRFKDNANPVRRSATIPMIKEPWKRGKQIKIDGTVSNLSSQFALLKLLFENIGGPTFLS